MCLLHKQIPCPAGVRPSRVNALAHRALARDHYARLVHPRIVVQDVHEVALLLHVRFADGVVLGRVLDAAEVEQLRHDALPSARPLGMQVKRGGLLSFGAAAGGAEEDGLL